MRDQHWHWAALWRSDRLGQRGARGLRSGGTPGARAVAAALSRDSRGCGSEPGRCRSVRPRWRPDVGFGRGVVVDDAAEAANGNGCRICGLKGGGCDPHSRRFVHRFAGDGRRARTREAPSALNGEGTVARHAPAATCGGASRSYGAELRCCGRGSDRHERAIGPSVRASPSIHGRRSRCGRPCSWLRA